MLKQKDAVYTIVKATLTQASIPFTEHLTDVSELLNKDLRKHVSMQLHNGLKAGEIELKKALDEVKLVNYASSLLSNWLKKDARLNGTPAKEAKVKIAKEPKPKKEKKAPKAPKQQFTEDQNQVEFNDDQNAVDPAAEDIPEGITAEEHADTVELETGVVEVLSDSGKKKTRTGKKKKG